MKFLKPHFWYNKNQRNGVLSLIIIIVILQIIIISLNYFVDISTHISTTEIKKIQKHIDSLKILNTKKYKTKIYRINPNFISDFKGYQLGMSENEIDRLHTYRQQNKWINSPSEFQKITQVSDSLLIKLTPYFKFPKWSKYNKNNPRKQKNYPNNKIEHSKIIFDINKATANDFKKINGIGETLSNRIIKYRNKLKGFYFKEQLNEVWGLNPILVKRIQKQFKIIQKPIIIKTNINTASFKEILKNPYVDYKLCKKIFDYKDEIAEYQNLNQLKEIQDFPIDKYHKIVLYLKAE